jgi:hypothetical protein
VLVVRHGTLVYEQYFAGEDVILGDPRDLLDRTTLGIVTASPSATR